MLAPAVYFPFELLDGMNYSVNNLVVSWFCK